MRTLNARDARLMEGACAPCRGCGTLHAYGQCRAEERSMQGRRTVNARPYDQCRAARSMQGAYAQCKVVRPVQGRAVIVVSYGPCRAVHSNAGPYAQCKALRPVLVRERAKAPCVRPLQAEDRSMQAEEVDARPKNSQCRAVRSMQGRTVNARAFFFTGMRL